MALEWKARMYQEGDETGIVELINLVFPNSRYSTKRWTWEYRDNPYGYLTIVGEHNGEIVGHFGAPLFEVKVGDETIKCAQGCDLVVHPDFRRQGLFVALDKAYVKGLSDKGVVLATGFPNTMAHYVGAVRGQWFDFPRIPLLTIYFHTYPAITDRYGGLRRVNSATKQFSSFMDFFFSQMRGQRFTSTDDWKISKALCFDERIDEFWNRTSKHYGIIGVRNHKYLTWRYFDRQDVDYDVLVAEKDGQIEGYLVMTTQQSEKRKVGYIADVLTSSKDVFVSLVRKSVECLSSQKVDSINCWMLKDQIWYKLLREIGFTSLFQQKQIFLGRIISPRFLQMYKKAREWYVTYGDSDYV